MSEFIKRALTSVLILFSCGGAYLHSEMLASMLLTFICIIIAVKEWPQLAPGRRWWSKLGNSLVYPFVPMALLLLMLFDFYQSDFWLPLLPFCLSWAADVGGYVLGKLIGRHKMCPSISPGKSWEGFAGSYVAVFAVSWPLFARVLTPPFSWLTGSLPLMLFVSLLVTTVAFLGGLFVSWCKRRANVKDTGSVLPGHGGFLDRFDSVLGLTLLLWIMLVVGGWWL